MVFANLNSTSSTPVRMRLAEIDDAELIATVINSAFRIVEGWFVDGNRINVAGVRQFLVTGKFLLAENESGLLGCVYVESSLQSDPTTPKRSYLGLLSVDPARQQAGLGSVLMTAAEDYCRELGASVMDIKVVNLRETLFSFYRKRGYVETGTASFPLEVPTKEPCYFVVMSKQLRPADTTE